MTTVLSDVRDKYCYKSKYKRICPSQGDRDYLRKSNGSWDLKCKYDNMAKKQEEGKYFKQSKQYIQRPCSQRKKVAFQEFKKC